MWPGPSGWTASEGCAVSYCRFSDDNFKCDVYCYAGVGGYVTHVATARRVGDAPIPELPDQWWQAPVPELQAALNAQRAWLESARLEHIALPSAGKSYCDGDAAEAAGRLEALRTEGFRVPQHAIDALREEAAADRAGR